MHSKLPPGLLKTPIAHRGYHDIRQGRPENSPAAFRAAIENGYAIELDLQLSADGEAMVFHDETLERLTNETGLLAASTRRELEQIPLKHGRDTIRSLPEILALVAGRAALLIELKDQTGTMGVTDERLEAATARALQDYRGEIAVMSFNPHAVAAMARHAPQIARGLTTCSYRQKDWHPLAKTTCDYLRGIPDFERVGASFISHRATDLTRPRVLALKAQGHPVLCWTITSPTAEARAREHCDNITFERYAAPLPR